MADKIRELQMYDDTDDVDTDVNIIVQPGGVVNVNPDSERPIVPRPKWVKVLIAIAAAIASAGALAQAIHEAFK